MPLFDCDELHECVKQLATLDKEWLTVPQISHEDQFYARMVHFSTDKTLGVRTPQATKMLVMLNPVMLKHKPISLKCSYNVNKNWPLGHGQYRVSGNLGPKYFEDLEILLVSENIFLKLDLPCKYSKKN